MKYVVIILVILTAPFWGPFLLVFVLGILPSEKFYYEIIEPVPINSLVGKSFQTKLPLTIVQNYPQPYKDKGSQRLIAAASSGNRPPDSSCKIITQKTDKLLDTVVSTCHRYLKYSLQKQLILTHLPIGSTLEVVENYQLVEYKRPKRSSRKFITEFLLLEDSQGNLLETSIEFFNSHVLNPTSEIDANPNNLLIQEVMNKIEQDGFVKILVCAIDTAEDYRLSELKRFIDNFHLDVSLDFDYSNSDNTCANPIIVKFSFKYTYIRTLYFSKWASLLEGNWKILD